MPLFIFISFIFMGLAASGQTYPDPEFVEKPMYYDPATNTISALERQLGFSETMIGPTTTMIYKGAHSPFRIKKSSTVQFLIRLVNPVELDLVLFVYHLEPNEKDNTRRLKAGYSFRTASSTLNVVPFQYKKVGEHLYLISFDDLAPGEYFWYFTKVGYFFGVDE